MPDHTLKSFGQLHEDYAFFERHANETEQSLAAWLPLVRRHWDSLHALDFGAGSGSFTSTFLQAAQFDPAQLQLTLIEPDDGFRAQALAKLAPYSEHPIQAWPLLDRDIEPTFDLIFSHHVLYYVPNLKETLKRLVGSLRPGGRMLIVQGGQGNGMNQLVWAGFRLLGKPAPYNYSEDTMTALQDLGVTPQVQLVRSAVDFADSAEGRWHMLRFLLGEHLSHLSSDQALKLFEPFLHDGRVRFESADELFIIDKNH